MNKVALVTGSSSGLGLHLSVLLAKEDFKTFATMRNLDKKERLLSTAKQEGVEV